MALRQFARISVGFLFLVAFGIAGQARAQNWDGSGQIRFGAFLQGSFTDYSVDQTPLALPAFRQSVSPDGFGGGIVVGYDLHLGRFVIGAEADVSIDNGVAKVSSGIADQYGVDYMATVRGRLGTLVHPDILLYGTAGIAMLGAEYKLNPATSTISISGNSLKKNANMTGFAIGGGLEYDAGWGTVFAEYLHNDYGSWSFRNFNGNLVNIDATADVIRLGLKFKVGHDFERDIYARDRMK